MKWRQLLTICVLPCLLLLAAPALAQNRTVTGKVTDATGAPLAGASVVVKGSKRGAVTDANGKFTLQVPVAATTVVISWVGYRTQEVAIGDGAPLDISLQPGANANLNEVVVIGYGAVQKKDLTGAVSSVNAKDFQQGAITSADQLIQGKVAGVAITTNGGQPGNSSTIRIRGLASLNGNQDPLYVIDGVELPPMKKLDGTSSVSGTANPLSLMNPDDIENITILKDASAEAIYGSRGAAGVIIITTKKGRGGKPVFNFNTQLTVGTVAKRVQVLSASQYRAFAAKDLETTPGDTIYTDLMGSASTDWQKQIYQTAVTTNDNLSVSGVAKHLPYHLSLGYHDEQGILKTDKLQRGTVGIHLTPSFLHNHLKVELNLNGSLSKSRFANQGAIGDAISFDPTQPVYQPGNKFGGYWQWTDKTGTFIPLATQNPVALLEQYNSTGYSSSSIGNLHLNYEVPGVDGLHAIADWGYDVANGHGTVVIPPNAAQAINNSPGPGQWQQYKQNNTYVSVNYGFNYIRDFKAIKSNLNAMATYSYTNNLITTYNYANFDAAHDTISGSAPTYLTSPTENTLISYLGRVIYTYDQKYILTATLRDDGSSRFSPANRWGLFPSAALAWRVSQEDFLKNTRWLTDLKIRGSYGVTGNQDGIPNYEYIPTYSLGTNNSLYQFGDKFYPLYSPAAYFPNLRWETTKSTNIGIDYGLFNNRISGSIEYYYKNISNLLNSIYIPVGSNFTNLAPYINIGSMVDHGVELTVNATPIKGKNFTWDLSYNFTYLKNRITKLTNQDQSASFVGDQVGGIGGGTGNDIQVQTVGYTANSFFVLQQIYGKNGKPIEGLYADRDRNGTVSYPADAYRYKSPFAPVTMGFSSTFNYMRWSLTLVTRASIGNYVYNNINSGLGATKYILHNGLGYLSNATTDIYNSGFVNPQYFSDYYVQNASFFKLDNLGIGYNVGNLNSHVSLRLNANCQNVFVITKYTGVDPEVYNGIDNNLYPRPRNFTIGASLNF
ncbi:MAG TPA: TonB-dependent receptor [Dinghuibacter sp.]|uniref:SusC/RagA family TonB-linked outer membrane protein n=1 Tax=Dinghuibacter sp. TaxID=2024697 RepID=UPI002CAB65F0|nr:TonB-dependent receptor [Dinghuibacter sp.]HTJ10694.1 TonB-dependent receptor [Dinghuibacter sp.]